MKQKLVLINIRLMVLTSLPPCSNTAQHQVIYALVTDLRRTLQFIIKTFRPYPY